MLNEVSHGRKAGLGLAKLTGAPNSGTCVPRGWNNPAELAELTVVSKLTRALACPELPEIDDRLVDAIVAGASKG